MMTEIPPAETQLEGTGGPSPTMDARTRLLLEAPIGRTLLLLAAPKDLAKNNFPESGFPDTCGMICAI